MINHHPVAQNSRDLGLSDSLGFFVKSGDLLGLKKLSRKAFNINKQSLCEINSRQQSGALPSEVRQFFSKFFWKPLFSPFYGTLFIINRKYFFGFSKSAPTPRYTNQKVQLQLDFLLLIKKSPATAGLIKKSIYSWTNQKVQL